MPLPKPKANEDQKTFMNRCVNDTIVKKEFKDQDQAIAICYNQWRKK
tara:strand:+ start:2366 stop:2506 length:141 start_codon:yes stop_codon:yes gene_type:complete